MFIDKEWMYLSKYVKLNTRLSVYDCNNIE